MNNPSDLPYYVSEEDISPRSKSPSYSEDELNEMIIKKGKVINKELFRQYFQFQSLSNMKEKLFKTQNTQENKN